MTTLSYTIFLVIFALIVYIGTAVEVHVEQSFYPASEVFSLFILSVGFVFFIYLYIDIRMHVNKAQQAVKDKDERIRMMQEQLMRTEEDLQNSFEMAQTSQNFQLQIRMPNMQPIKPIPHRYCFAGGRHGELYCFKIQFRFN